MPAPGRGAAPPGPAGVGRHPLSEAGIVDTALTILRAEGLEAVTMRRVAAELGAAPASLYTHISGRDELHGAMLEHVAGSIPLPVPDAERWRRQVHELLGGLLRALAQHPGMATVAAASPGADERSLMVSENLLGLLGAGGIEDRDAAWAGDILQLLVFGVATASEPGDEPDDEGGAFVALPPDRFPNITRLARELGTGSPYDRFAFAVDALLDGLLARSAPR